MGYGYQQRDYEYVDYRLWDLEGVKQPFRGPKPELLAKNQYLLSFTQNASKRFSKIVRLHFYTSIIVINYGFQQRRTFYSPR
jgi:hypothetical protein